MRALLVCCAVVWALPLSACTCSSRDTPRKRPDPPHLAGRDTAPPPAAPDAAQHAVVVPALFSPLFVKGRAWTYDYSYEYPDHVPFSGPTTMLHDGTLRCQVEEVQALKRAKVSRVHCRLFEEAEDLAGEGEEAIHPLGDAIYIANERGLWIGDPDDCKELSSTCVGTLEGAPYLAAEPKAGRVVKKNGKNVTITVELQRQAVLVGETSVQSWCHKLTQLIQRERNQDERCFAPERGLVRQTSSLKKLNVARPDEEAAMGDPSWWKGSITQTGEWKAKPKPASVEDSVKDK